MTLRVLACVLAASATVLAQGNLVCFPSAPSASIGSTVSLDALYEPAGAVDYQWKVSTGAIRSQNGQTVWDLAGAEPGIQNADVNAVINGSRVASCGIELQVDGRSAPKRRSTLSPVSLSPLTARTFLAPGQTEGDGYGLYSYILFAARPSAADKDRYTAIFSEVLRLLHPIEAFARVYKPAQLNATWLPVARPATQSPDAKWLLDNYDYDLAAALIAKAGITGNPQGIYIVSVSKPLTRFAATPPFLKQDLSRVTAPLAATWITMFINQAAQQHYWTPDRLDQMAANLRLAIAVAAQGVPQVKTALGTLIGMVK